MIKTRVTTVLTGTLADAMSDESRSVIRSLTKDLIDRISDIFLTAVVMERLDPADYIGEKLGIVITIEDPAAEEEKEEWECPNQPSTQ